MSATFAATNAVTQAALAGTNGFVPELWSDEVLAAYKANLVMPQLVTTLNFVGQKGDTVHIPRPARGHGAPPGRGRDPPRRHTNFRQPHRSAA